MEHPPRGRSESDPCSCRAAGSRLITTNAFGGLRFVLNADVRTLNHAATRVARALAGDDAWVIRDLAPCGDFLEPVGDLTEDEVRDAFRDQSRPCWKVVLMRFWWKP
jgi:5-methyltetrahydrofolate--homocysteine methyltransferase